MRRRLTPAVAALAPVAATATASATGDRGAALAHEPPPVLAPDPLRAMLVRRIIVVDASLVAVPFYTANGFHCGEPTAHALPCGPLNGGR
jgi:hypothetical protein